MKIVLTERAIHEFNALNSLTRSKDEKAIELLTRLSFTLIDMMQYPGINDSNFGKVKHCPGVPVGYLGGQLSGCIARNIDKSNRLIACEINGTAVILSFMGHYGNPILGLDEDLIRKERAELIKDIELDSGILSNLEKNSSAVVELARRIGHRIFESGKDIYTEIVSEFNKKLEERIFPTDIFYVMRMIPDRSKNHKDKQKSAQTNADLNNVRHAIEKEYSRTISNAVRYSICYAFEESGQDQRQLLENQRKYYRIIHKCIYDMAVRIIISKIDDTQKERATKEVFQGYAYAIGGIRGSFFDSVCPDNEVSKGIVKWVLQTALHLDDNQIVEDFYSKINDLAVNNIDIDRVFVKSVYKRQLDDLKAGQKVAYYISEKNVVEFTENWSDCHEKAPTANDVLKVWGSTVETAEDGIIPEDAVEVCFDKRYVHYINPEYRAHDLGRAIELATAIYQEKSIAEVRADLPVSVFIFADEESWDRCQAMIEMAISRNRKPPAGRNKEPPAGRNEDPPVR